MSFLPSLRRGRALTPASSSAFGELVPHSPMAEQKALLSSYYGALASSVRTTDRSQDWPVERAVRQGYERIIWIFKSVNRISRDSARLPFTLVDGEAEVEDHPLLDLLNDGWANPMERGHQFRKRLSAQVLLSKRGAFVEVTRSNAGTPMRLDLLPPGRTKIVPGAGDRLIDHYEVQSTTGAIKRLDPATVLWFRDEHPLDPYSGITPLEALGLSIELDHFARLYNVSFLRNDGRPGGVLAINPPRAREGIAAGDVDERILDRIESRFRPGPTEAGKISVVTGELSYTDLAHSPRDLSYGETSQVSKRELLAGFGVSESVLGYSADRTFDNAEQETHNYWTVTMEDHNGLIETGFTPDGDDLTARLDTSGIEVLQRARRQKLADAREEFAAGLRSIWSYAVLAGLEDEIEETAHTRALYIPSGKTAVPANEEDAAELGLGPIEEGAEGDPATDPNAGPAGTGGDAAPAGTTSGGVGISGGGDVQGTIDAAAGAPAAGQPVSYAAPSTTTSPTRMSAPLSSTGMAAARAAGEAATAATMASLGGTTIKSARPRLRIVREAETKAEEPDRVSSLSEEELAAVEAEVLAALEPVVEKWVERTAARLTGHKFRRGTRHWTPEFEVDTRVGRKALDAPRMADEEQWATEAVEAVEPVVAAAALAAAGALIEDADAGDAYTSGQVTTMVASTVAAVLTVLRESAGAQARRMSEVINDLDQRAVDLGDIVDTVRARGAVLLRWAQRAAATAATATTNGARDQAAAAVVSEGYADVQRQWFARRDERTRETHRAAHKQVRPLGTPFVVGTALLMYPGDPAGPPGETYNCRCRVAHRLRSTGQFVARPA